LDKVKQLGQYFTPDFVADFMVSLSSKPHSARVLEPASGEGVFLSSLRKAGYRECTGYEIDADLSKPEGVETRNESFISTPLDAKFDLVIGNPPYVRWKNMAQAQKDELSANALWAKYFNSLSDYLYIFILKSVEQLEEGGELLFITPEYWLNTMHSASLRNYLIEKGFMQEVYHFSETPIFNKVASSIIIFKYVKSSKKDKSDQPVRVHKFSSKKRLTAQDLAGVGTDGLWENFTIGQFRKNESWILAPEAIKCELARYEQKCTTRFDDYHQPTLLPEEEMPFVKLGDIADIANGLVSGLDKAFQLPQDVQLNEKEARATLSVIKAKDMHSYAATLARRYIYLNDASINEVGLKKEYPAFYDQLLPYKADLLKRYDYGREIPYWDWVFLRSMKLFQQARPKIFVPCKERITNKRRLRFCIADAGIYPTQDVTAIYLHQNVREDIYYILALLNSQVTYDWVRYKGLIKGGIAEFSERPLSVMPIRLIDWSRAREVEIHNEVVAQVRQYIHGQTSTERIDVLLAELLQ
jgi:adenine-specific DNA-methyltransferase